MKKVFFTVLTLVSLFSFQIVQAADKVVFGTNWLAQGGHGGFYQAIADGTYEKYGLDVEISMGGPQMNNRPMLIAKKLDFLMTGNLLLSFDNVRNGIPTMVVAAFFQKDPQAMLIHEGSYSSFSDLTTAPTILVSKDGQFSYWKWMVNAHGFRDEQVNHMGIIWLNSSKRRRWSSKHTNSRTYICQLQELSLRPFISRSRLDNLFDYNRGQIRNGKK